MQFVKTINLWAEGVTQSILDGSLKLQRGQWVKCGENGDPARFVKVFAKNGSGTIWVAHSEGDHKTTRSFKRLCEAAGTKKRKHVNK